MAILHCRNLFIAMRWLESCITALTCVSRASATVTDHVEALQSTATRVELYDSVGPLGSRVSELVSRGWISIDHATWKADYTSLNHDHLSSILSKSTADAESGDGVVYRVGTETLSGVARLPPLISPVTNRYEERITLHVNPKTSQSPVDRDVTTAATSKVADLGLYHVSYKLLPLPSSTSSNDGSVRIETTVVVDNLQRAQGAAIDLVQRQRKTSSGGGGESAHETTTDGTTTGDGPEEVEEPQPPQTFLQKYGIYIIPAVLVLVLNGVGGGGGSGGGT